MSADEDMPAAEDSSRDLAGSQRKKATTKPRAPKRKRSDDRPSPAKKLGWPSKKKKKKKQAKKTTEQERNKKDDLLEHDQGDLELPTEQDFRCPYGPVRSSYTWAVPLPVVEDGNAKFHRAPQPAIADAGMASHRTSERAIPIVNHKKIQKKDETASKRAQRHAEDLPRCHQAVVAALPTFLGLPMEVREEIYRHLLVAQRPVLVRAGWSRIYEREKPGLQTSILRASKQINLEAIRILYGENTFHYRLRDPPNTAHEVVDIMRLAEQDYYTDVETDDDDSRDLEYGGWYFGRSSGRAARRHAETPWDINIPKFGVLFRHLIVEAEHNRYSLDTQRQMARAISVFTAQSGGGVTKAYTEKGKKGKARATNIHTLSIRVAPMWNEEKRRYTFVDFFRVGLPVLEAMRALSCQFICVELITRHLTPFAPPPNARFLMDMRHRRIARRANRGIDVWAHDGLMLRERSQRVAKSLEALHALEENVKIWCRKHGVLRNGEILDPDAEYPGDMMDVEDWGEF